jgi:hypothetical protein
VPALLLAALLAGAAGSGCAPTTLGPHVLRMDPGVPGRAQRAVGLKTGPRLAAPGTPPSGASTTPFSGDANGVNLSQWGVAYDLALAHALTPQDSVHVGVQAEFAFPFPLPGYGLYGAYSRLEQWGPVRLVPAVTLHGASDLGLGVTGGAGTQGGLELSATLGYRPLPALGLAVAPFLGVNGVTGGRGGAQGGASLYLGAVLALVIEGASSGRPGLELTGGFGRVLTPGGPSWNVPLVGVRAIQ